MNTASSDIDNETRLRRALVAIKTLRAQVEELGKARREPVAIIGMACRFPGGVVDPEGLWTLVCDGVDAVSEIPPERWAMADYYDADPDAPGKTYAYRAGLVAGSAEFDAQFFGISRREATVMDPQHRLMLEVSWEALENAGIAPAALAEARGAVIAGITLNDYDELIRRAGAGAIGPYQLSGNCLSFAPGRVAYVLGLQGPALAIDSACSSSLVSIHLAGRSLRQGECDIALAGGVNLFYSADHMVMVCKNRMAAPDGKCKTFDAAADGYARGEGCAMVVLKRLSDAMRDGDPIHAVIRGSAVNHDGHSSGLTVPNGLAQQAVIRQALDDAGLDPAAIDYLEAHGTGTALGDPIEVAAISAVYAAARPPGAPVAVGSIKSNIGHLESAAGVAGLFKVVLAMQHTEIPPTLHLTRLNPHIVAEPERIIFPTQRTPWSARDGVRRAAVSSFGASGTNAHLIVEQAPPVTAAEPTSVRACQLLCLSAHTPSALRAQAERYASHLRAQTAVALRDSCYTAAVGRTHFAERLAVLGANTAEIARLLERFACDEPDVNLVRGSDAQFEEGDVVFLFTGQGAQFPGMGRDLYDAEPSFRAVIDRCDAILRDHLPISLASILLHDAAAGTRPLIHQTRYTQPALFAFEYALAETWRAWGIVPTAVIGHSIGEIAAACFAGVMSLEDGLALVAARGRLMQDLPAGGAMAAIGCEQSIAEEIVARMPQMLAIAAVNAPRSTTLSGAEAAVDAALSELGARGVRGARLEVSHAFHSPLMEPMLAEFRGVAAGIRYAAPRVRLISNLTGQPLDDVVDADYWCRHVRQPVTFAAGMAWLGANAFRRFVEVGPGGTLVGLGQQCLEQRGAVWIQSLPRSAPRGQGLSRAAAQLYVNGVQLDWRAFHGEPLPRRVRLPTYPFERKTYWAVTDDGQPRTWQPLAPASAPSMPTDAGRAGELRELERSGVVEAADVAAFERVSALLAEHQASRAGTADWLYQIQWREVAQRPRADADRPGRWLIIGNDDLADVIVRQLSAGGDQCQRLGTQADAWLAEVGVAAEGAAAWPLKGILFLAWPDSDGFGEQTSVGELERYHAQTLGCLLELIKTAARLKLASDAKIWILTRGAVALSATAPLTAPAQAVFWGLGKTLALEHPNIWGGVLDLPPSNEAGNLEQVPLALRLASAENELAAREGRLYAPRLTRLFHAGETPPQFRADASYLITGGGGGLGLELAGWLVQNGVRNLILVGRRAPASAVAAATVARLEQAGARVLRAALDVTRRADVADLLARVERELGPLRGVFHCAGIIDNGMLLQKQWPSFAAVFAPKVTGSWILHELTRRRELDYFVLFSSTAAVIGSDGQGSYAAANAFLDALAHYRRALGLPALSINWGPWGGVGLTAQYVQAERGITARGLALMAAPAALATLPRVLGAGSSQITVVDARWPQIVGRYAGSPLSSTLRELDSSRATPTAQSAPSTAISDLEQQLRTRNEEGRYELLVSHIQSQIMAVLDLDPDEVPDVNQGFFDIGMDSLMAVELRVRLAASLDRPLPTTVAFDFPTARELALHLLRDVLGLEPERAAPKPRVPLIDEIRNLSDTELEDVIEQELRGLGPN